MTGVAAAATYTHARDSTMKKFIIILAATTALAAPAFSQSLGETTGVK